MRVKAIFRIICAMLVLMAFSSCVLMGGKDQLEYDNTPYKEYNFGRNNEISIQLPTPVVAYDDPYSNIIRRKWVGSGFIDYFPITRITVAPGIKEDYPKNSIIIQLNNDIDKSFILYREFVIHVYDNKPIIMTLLTATSQTMKYGQETINRFVTEDNDLFEKILRSVRIRGQDGKLLEIKVNYDALKKRIQEIYFAPKIPTVTFEIPYELIEAQAAASVEIPAQAVPAVQGKN